MPYIENVTDKGKYDDDDDDDISDKRKHIARRLMMVDEQLDQFRSGCKFYRTGNVCSKYDDECDVINPLWCAGFEVKPEKSEENDENEAGQ